MSIELKLRAFVPSKLLLLNGDEKDHIVYEHFRLWHIGSEKARMVYNLDSVYNMYLETIKEFCPEDEEQIPIYSEDDIYEESDPIDYKTTPSERIRHTQELDRWLEEHKYWNVEWYLW